MALTQIFLALAVSSAAAAPMEGLSNTYLPPPPSSPPETYLPPTTPSPPPETYLPPTTPSPEYLPPPPSNEYLPPPEKEYLPPPADDLGQAEGGIIADTPVDNSLSELSGQDAGQDGGESAGGESAGGESAGGESAGGQSAGGAGYFDDGLYHPEQYNSGKYDPNAGKFTGDDGQYHPEKIEFPPIEDFEFAYAVKDKDSGNDFGLSETNKGGVYRVLLPDGRIQIVQFVIDSRGIYRSRITYLQPEDSQ